MTYEIGVVVPVFNRASILLSTLDSVAAQTLLPSRVVVVDDGSTDGSAESAAKWLSRHARLFDTRLIRQDNRGVAAARNRGFAAAQPCSFVAFLDSDDCWPQNFLERAAPALAECPAAVCASCDREIQSEWGSTVHCLEALADSPIAWILKHGGGVMSASLLRAAAIEKLGGFDESLLIGEDAALLLPLSLEGPWLHLPGAPALFDVGLRFRGDSAVNRSLKLSDSYSRLARTYEDFVVRGGGSQFVAPDLYRRLLSRAWYFAGRELTQCGSLDDARECFQIAYEWNPRSYRVRGCLALLEFHRLCARMMHARAQGTLALDAGLHATQQPAQAT